MTGILGIPFFNNSDVALNLGKGEMIINMQNKENLISLPPRLSNILNISISSEDINNGDEIVVNKENVSNSVWLGNTISICTNNSIMAIVMNIFRKL